MNDKNQKFFQDFVRYKDKLGGFDDLVENRYFMNREEFIEDLNSVGFDDVEIFDLGIKYVVSTKKSGEVDLGGDEEKLRELNEYVRELGFDWDGVKVEDLGDDIRVEVPALVSVARK